MSVEIDLTNRLDNLIFPIGEGIFDENSCTGFNLYGTAFLIGQDHYALTAGHVIQKIVAAQNGVIAGIFKDNDNKKYASAIIVNEDGSPSYEPHPTEDICLLKLQIDSHIKVRPPFFIDPTFRIAGQDFYSVGYPEHLKFDNHLRPRAPDGSPITDEINILLKGYIRRLVHYVVPKFKGSKFLELSEVGSAGYSGAPIICRYGTTLALLNDGKKVNESIGQRLLGIYIGENRTELAGGDSIINIGYATSVEAFADWKPKMLHGKNIREIMTIYLASPL